MVIEVTVLDYDTQTISQVCSQLNNSAMDPCRLLLKRIPCSTIATKTICTRDYAVDWQSTKTIFRTCFSGFAVSVSSLSVSYGSVLQHEPQPYVPSNPIHEEDIEKLLSIESQGKDNWSRVKKSSEYEVWRRTVEGNEPPVTKVGIKSSFIVLSHYTKTVEAKLFQ